MSLHPHPPPPPRGAAGNLLVFASSLLKFKGYSPFSRAMWCLQGATGIIFTFFKVGSRAPLFDDALVWPLQR